MEHLDVVRPGVTARGPTAADSSERVGGRSRYMATTRATAITSARRRASSKTSCHWICTTVSLEVATGRHMRVTILVSKR